MTLTTAHQALKIWARTTFGVAGPRGLTRGSGDAATEDICLIVEDTPGYAEALPALVRCYVTRQRLPGDTEALRAYIDLLQSQLPLDVGSICEADEYPQRGAETTEYAAAMSARESARTARARSDAAERAAEPSVYRRWLEAIRRRSGMG